MKPVPPGTLYLLPAPLRAPSAEGWNLESISAELPAGALALMRSLDFFVVESQRSALRLLSRLRDPEAMERLVLSVLDEHSKEEEIAALLAPLVSGRDMGLLSEAGIPCVADPGAALVALAHAAGATVRPVSGPSSLMLALAASGLGAQRFSFLGYLPAEAQARRGALSSLSAAFRRDGLTRMFIETPYRNDRLFSDCLELLAPDILLCVASDLAGESERVACRSVREWKESGEKGPGKKPAVFLFGAAASARPPDTVSAAPSDLSGRRGFRKPAKPASRG